MGYICEEYICEKYIREEGFSSPNISENGAED